MIKEILSLIVFVIMIFITWCFITDTNDDIITCIRKKLNLVKSPTEPIQPEDTKGDTPDPEKTCSFEGEDLIGGHVYKTDGTPITQQPDINCSECTEYVYRDKTGKCYAFIHDAEYNADRICEENNSEDCKNVCTAKFTPLDACPF